MSIEFQTSTAATSSDRNVLGRIVIVALPSVAIYDGIYRDVEQLCLRPFLVNPPSETTLALEQLIRVPVPPELLQRGLGEYSERAARKSSDRLSTILLDRAVAMALPGNPLEIAISAQFRILALACIVREGLLEEWVQRGNPDGIVLFHASLFMAAAVEPLIVIPPDRVGFDPASLRRNVLQLAAAKGSG